MALLKNKLALITGASRGIGAAVAKRYAQEGADLILAARSVADLEVVDDEIKKISPQTSVLLVPIDLKYPLQIEEMIRAIMFKFGRLDILVGNAAFLGTLGPLTHQSSEEWQEVLDINLSANWHLLRLCDPLLKKAPEGRALFVTSEVAKYPFPYWGSYSITKAALEHMVKMYALENKTSSVKVNLIDPGNVRTRMHATAMPGVDPFSLPLPEEVVDIFVRLALKDCASSGEIFMAQAS